MALLITLALAVTLPFQAIRGEERRSPSPGTANRANNYLIAREGKGYLEEISGQRVLHLRGSHYEMGYQAGRLLAKEARETCDGYLRWSAKRRYTLERLLKIFEQASPFIPKKYHDEMKGLADGSGIPLRIVQATHIIPTVFHCSGAAVFGKATVDGKLYHYRSLDYSLKIGTKEGKKVQENACLTIFSPRGEIPHVVVGWAGALGCVTGMNARGISVGEMGSGCRDENRAGLPMWFQLREILARASKLPEAVELMKNWKRTCGFNFIVADGKIPDAVAVEVTRSHVEFFRAGSVEEDVPPHFPIKNAVRRVNHFVSPRLAATQRKIYDPVQSEPASWTGYKLISDYIIKHYGRFDGARMIGLCRQYPMKHSCLHQAVFCPTDLRFWVANAVDPVKVEYAGAQNQTFYPYSLKELLEKDPASLRSKPQREAVPEGKVVESEGILKGTCTSRLLVIRDDDDPEMRALLKSYQIPRTPFSWTMKPIHRGKSTEVYAVTFPSPVKSAFPVNNTVHGKYFRPARSGRFPAVVLLHHLAGDFTGEELLGAELARRGIASLMIWMPFYGKRRPKGIKARLLQANLDDCVAGLRQAILDIRRSGDWLAARPEIRSDRIGVMGISLGAVIGSMTAGIDRHFKRNVFILGGGDIPGIVFHTSRETRSLRKTFKKRGISEADLRRAWRSIEPLTYAGRIDPRGVIMINSHRDQVIPKHCTVALWEKMGRPEIQWYDTTHEGLLVHVFEILKRCVKHLKAPAPEAMPRSKPKEKPGPKPKKVFY
jgi:predicted choloylglycine hydrolase/cephalosporin-C deacetylase-like acetyl esterase